MITFQTTLTKKGNIKVPADVLELISARPRDAVIVSVDLDCDSLMISRYDNDSEDGIAVPFDLLDEAGIDSENYQIYADNGRVVILEGEEFDE